MGYFPNGDSGRAFEDEFCANCKHDAAFRAWTEAGEHGSPPEGCPVWGAHLLFSYELCNQKDHPGKVILDMLIDDDKGCAMFISKDGDLPGQRRLF